MKKVIAFKEKKELLFLSLNVLIEYLQELNEKNFNGTAIHYLDAIESLKEIKFTKEIKYRNALFFVTATGSIYLSLLKRINDGSISIEHMNDPDFWKEELDREKVLEAIFFTYSLFTELFKEQLKIDLKNIEDMSIEEFLNFRSKLKE